MTTRSGLQRFASVVVTGLSGLAGLLFLASALMSGLFASDVPQGANAVGLVVPLAGSVIAVGAQGLAFIVLASTGRTRCLGIGPWTATALALLSVVAPLVMLIAWMEAWGDWVFPAGVIAGLLMPLMLAGVAIRLAWRAETALPDVSARRSFWVLVFAAILSVCVAVLGWMGESAKRKERETAQREWAAAQEVAEEERRAAQTPAEQMKEDPVAEGAARQ